MKAIFELEDLDAKFIVAQSILDLMFRVKGRRKATPEQIEQLNHFAKQGVKVRLK